MLINKQWDAFDFIIAGNNSKPPAKAVVCITKLRGGLWGFGFLSGADPNADLPIGQGAHVLRCRFEQSSRFGDKTPFFILTGRSREGMEL